MKTRFTSLDIAASIASFRDSLLGLRVSNVYDINPKCYLFKLAKPDKKEWLLIESGIRIHSTRFTREKNTIPSAFTLKLRKHLRTKRIEAIEQLGVDRVVKITFGTGAAIQHLIIEFYASGNIILTDADLVILTVLRTHKYDDNTIVAPHNVYPLQTTKQFVPITEESLANILSAETPLTIKSEREDELEEKNQPKNEMHLKVILSNETELGTLLIEHCLLKIGINPQTKLRDYDKQQNSKLLHELQIAQNIFINKTNTGEGYILLHQGKSKTSKKKSEKSAEENNNAAPAEGQEALYDDFMPILFLQYANRPHLKFGTFDEAIDEYFSKIESQKLTLQAAQQEASVLSKLDKVKKDQQRRIEELNKNESLNRTKARLIEMNLKDVDQVLHIIRSAVASSMDWTKLNEIIKEEKKKGDPTANMIHKLNLEKNQVTLYLTNTSDDISDEELSSPACLVDIDLSLSAHANATYYFDLKKKSNVKAKKTIDAAEQAVKAAEKKTRMALKEVKVKTEIKHARKPLWFEKFNWFITTDNFLIISGKDMQQNEQLYRRYLKKGDLYIHADLSGAASCIVKNPSNAVIPPSTLLQAGDFSVCHSAAWNEKIVTSAWWVDKDQVSKTAPSGEFLTTGSFMIRGKKNYLPPSTLILGFGIMFKLHEESIAKHKALRKQTQEAFSDNENQHKEDDTELQVDESEQNEAEPEPLKESGQAHQTNEPNTEVKLLGSDQSHLRSLGFGVQNSDDLDDESDVVESDSSVSKKKRTSAKERRQIKKGQTNSSDNQDGAMNTNTENTQLEETSSKEKQSKTPLPRGKRSKEKKAKEKYKDQDDEERSLKMQLLGSVGKQPEKQDKQPPKQTPKQNNATQKKKQEPVKPKPTTTQTNEEEEEVKNILKEENLNEIDDDKDKSEDLDLLDSLTGAPLPDDILLFCVPVCGPYSAMNNFKYKVKLTPGSAKRGKAVKTILKFFLHNENITPQERDLIKNMPEQEAIQQIVGNVKISTPGLFAQTKKGKHD